MQKIYNVLLDTKDEVKNPSFVVNTNDLKSVKINVLINQDGEPLDLTGATVRLAVKKPDKTTVLQDITVMDALAGSCEIVLNTQAYVIDGKYDAEVMVYFGVDTVAVTGRFSYKAVRGILDDATVESTNEWQSINQAIANAEGILIDLRENGTGVDAQARADIATQATQLTGIATNVKALGLKGDGITDDTNALSTALNSATITKFFAPKGNYVLTNTITVNSTPKVIEGTEGTVFKINLLSSATLFDLLSNVTFKNVVFDFSDSYCKNAILYRANFGEVKLSNVEIRNVKDIDSTTSSALINILAEGNKIDLEKITFKNILKRGNGNITDGAGSINGIYYNGTITTASALGGSIRNVYVENLHNINSSDAVILEDTTGIYISLSGKKSNVKIYDVNGLEFGKRLLKIQASDIDIDKVRGESTTGDSLSVVGALSEPGVFASDDVRISNVIAKGNMDYAIAISASNTVVRDSQIDLYGSNALNSGTNHFGIHLSDGANNTKITKTKIKSKRPIGLFNSTTVLKDVALNDVDITLTANAGAAVTQLFNSAYGYDGLYLNNVNLKMDVAPTGTPSLITTETTFTGRNKNLNINRINIDALDPVSGTYCKSNVGLVRFTDTVSIKDVAYNNTAVGTQASDLLSVLDSTDVTLEGIKTLVKSNRTLLLQRLTGLKVKEQGLDGEGITGHIVLIDTTRTEIDSKNEKYKIVYGTQDATEVLRNKGTTAQRPKRAYQSYRYYDTTLNKDIVVKTGAVIATDYTVTTPPVWVDAMGTTV